MFDKESKAVHISSLVVGIAFVCVSAFFVGKNFVIYNNYKAIYGAYAKEEHGPDAAYEDKVMNYNERAVANGDELFFFHKTENAICKVKKAKCRRSLRSMRSRRLGRWMTSRKPAGSSG